MYKKMSYDEILKIKSHFLDDLHYVLQRGKYPSLSTYLTAIRQQWEVAYHIVKQEPFRRTVFVPWSENVIFFDEKEKIELHADKMVIGKIHSLMKDSKKRKQQTTGAQSITQILQKQADAWQFAMIAGKSYLVYDIETSYATDDLRTMEFYIASAYIVQDGKGIYKHIEKNNLEKFVQFMLDFDGYIIWFNHMWFDNPVCIYNLGEVVGGKRSEDQDALIQCLNQKSLDLMVFVQEVTGRRMWLNKIAKSLVWVQKTLESAGEIETLWKLYQAGGDEWADAFKKLKHYCKNDVTMTLMVLRYILSYQTFSFDNEEYHFGLDDFLRMANVMDSHVDEGDDRGQTNVSLFA